MARDWAESNNSVLFGYTAYRGRQMKRAGGVREMEMGASHV